MSPYNITSLHQHYENMTLCQTPNHCKIWVLSDHPESQLWAQVVSLTFWCQWTFLLRAFYIPSSGIRCICLCHARTDVLSHLPICNSTGDSRAANVCAGGIMCGSADFLQNSFFEVGSERCASAMFWEQYELWVLHWKSKSAGNILEVNRGQLPEMRTQGTLCLANMA